MASIYVSAHGGRWEDQEENLVIPENSKVVYYVHDGVILSNENGYEIFEELKNGNEPGGQVANEIDQGDSTYNYTCWFANEFPNYCGIYEVGTGDLLKDLSRYTEDYPLSLSDIIAEFPNETIYWVCCREISQR
jgi:hypothetical protein